MTISQTARRTALLVAFATAIVVHARAQTSAAPPAADSLEGHLGKGYDDLRQERYEAAAGEFRAALARDPTQVERAQFPLAVALFEMHNHAEARREFEAVRAKVGDHPNVTYYLGRLDLEDNNFSGAIREFSKAAAKPPFPDTAYYLGFAYFKQGDLAAAEKWLKQAQEATPQDARVPYQLGLVYHKLGKEDEARKAIALSSELRQRDNHESAIRQECSQKLQQGSRAEAHAICDQLYDPDNADKLTELGTLYGKYGDAEAALKPLRRAAELSPQSPQTQYNLAMAYYQLGQFEQARGPLSTALKRWPDLFQLNVLYGAVLAKLGDEVAAYQALRHAHELNSQDAGTSETLYALTRELGEKSQQARQFPDALRYFGEAAKLRPEDPEPHRRMAEIYTAIGRTPQASEERQEADRLAKNFVRPQ